MKTRWETCVCFRSEVIGHDDGQAMEDEGQGGMDF